MMIRKKDKTQPGRRKEQRSSDSTKENGNHTEEIQHGPSQNPPNIGDAQENGKKLNKRIRWSQKEMKEVLWCFTYIKEKALGEKYKEACKLWRDRNPMTRLNIEAKALLNQKNYILRTKRITAVEIDGIIENIRLKIGDHTEDYTKGMNGDKTDTNVMSTRRETKKVKILALVKQRITNTQVLKESSTQVGIN